MSHCQLIYNGKFFVSSFLNNKYKNKLGGFNYVSIKIMERSV